MYRDKNTLTTFAKIASDEYLKHKKPLNTAVKKLAQDEHLTPDQIEFVATTANRETWAKLFSLDKKAAYDFPLAIPQEIIRELQIKPETKTVDLADVDYFTPPLATKTASFDYLSAMGFQKEAMDGVGSEIAKKELKHVLQARFEKMAHLKERIQDERIAVQGEINQLEERFVKMAREMIITEPFLGRPRAMEQISEFVGNCGNVAQGRDLMRKLSYVLRQQGLMKSADLKAPEEYISDKLQARIVNGNHALYITVKTLFDKVDYASNLLNRYEIVDSSLPPIREKIREL